MLLWPLKNPYSYFRVLVTRSGFVQEETKFWKLKGVLQAKFWTLKNKKIGKLKNWKVLKIKKSFGGAVDKGALSTLSHLRTSANPITINNTLNTTYFQLRTPPALLSKRKCFPRKLVLFHPKASKTCLFNPIFRTFGWPSTFETVKIQIILIGLSSAVQTHSHLYLFSQRNLLAGKTKPR